jgi:hypothetical protein
MSDDAIGRLIEERDALRQERDAALKHVEFLLERARLLHEECVACGAALGDPAEPPYCSDTCAPTGTEVEEWEEAVAALAERATP